MRVSQYFKLGRSQSTLSFVDVDVVGDVPLFINPRALRLLPDAWGHECVHLIGGFFAHVLDLIRAKRHAEAVALLRQLREPNETHLGLSAQESRGRGLGSSKAEDVWSALSKSKAIKSGLVTDLEDTVLMVDHISVDIVSDIVTNIIRGPLIEYTNTVCEQYGIPLVQEIDSGPIWDQRNKDWHNKFVSLPVAYDKKLLLVPKIIVRYNMDYDLDKYYRKHILEHLKDAELKTNSQLVHVIKTGKNKGKRRVYKKDLKEKYGSGKPMVVEQTIKNPGLLDEYKKAMKEPSKPLTHRQLSDASDSPQPQWDRLLHGVTSLPTGNAAAADYEKAVEQLISALFYPVLASPLFQNKIHDGRKRIDITYSNMAYEGFFKWLSSHYPSSYVHFECKNYQGDVQNPELDQLSSRFSINRGKVGVMVCRSFNDRDLWNKRCRDTASDGREFILTLDDQDLANLVKERKNTLDFLDLPGLAKQFAGLTS